MAIARALRRWTVSFVLRLAFALALIAGLAYGGVALFATEIVVAALKSVDLPNPRMTVRSVGPRGAVLSDVTIGDGDEVRAALVELSYDVFDLAAFDLADVTVKVTDLVAAVALDETMTPSLGSLDALLFGGDGGGGGLPVAEVELVNARAVIDSFTYGRVEATLDGAARNGPDDAIDLDIAFDLRAHSGAVQGRLNARRAGDGALDGQAEIAQADVAIMGIGLSQASGDMTFARAPGGAGRGAGSIAFKALRLPAMGPWPDGLAIGQGRVAVEFDGAKLTANFDAASPSGLASIGGTLDVDNALGAGPAALDVVYSGAGEDLAWPAPALGPGVASGDALIAARVEIPRLDIFTMVGDDAQPPPARAEVEMLINDAALPGLIDGATVVGAFTLDHDAGALSLRADAPIQISLRRLPGALTGAGLATGIATDAPPALAGLLNASLDASLSGRGGRPLSLAFTPHEGGATVSGDAAAVIAVDDGPLLALELGGAVTLDADLTPLSANFEHVSALTSDFALDGAAVGFAEIAGAVRIDQNGVDAALTAAVTDLALAAPALVVSRAVADVDLAGDADHAQGALSLDLGDSDLALQDVDVEGLNGVLAGRLSLADGVLALRLGEAATFTARSAVIDDALAITEPTALTLIPGDAPVFEVDFSDPTAGPVLRHNFQFGPLALRGAVIIDERRTETVALDAPGLSHVGVFDAAGYSMAVAGQNMTVRAPGYGAVLRGLRVDAAMDGADPDEDLRVRLSAARLDNDDLNAVLDAISVRSNVSLRGDDLAFDIQLTDAGGQLALQVDGRHNLGDDRGRADVAMPDVVFAPGLLEPGQVSPLLARFRDATGRLDLSGDVTWTADGLNTRLAVLVDSLSMTFDDIKIEELNTLIEIVDLFPLRTASDQLLSIAAIDLGVPITDARIQFGLAPPMSLEIGRAEFTLAGGAVVAENQVLRLDPARQEFLLRVTGVELNELLKLFDLNGLTGTGLLDGEIPLVFIDGDVVIPQAELTARGPGVIRYDSAEELNPMSDSNMGLGLLMDVIRNYQYDSLAMTLARPVIGDVALGLHINGRNPDVYDGLPVELNLNVEGELDNIVEDSLIGYRMPQRLQERMLEYGFSTAIDTPSRITLND